MLYFLTDEEAFDRDITKTIRRESGQQARLDFHAQEFVRLALARIDQALSRCNAEVNSRLARGITNTRKSIRGLASLAIPGSRCQSGSRRNR